MEIHDSGGYALRGKAAKKGWVRKDDVVRLADALANYSGQIMSAEANKLKMADAAAIDETNRLLARLYWLRGIYWERADPGGVNPQFEIALLEFQKSTTLDSKLADAWLRQGRMLAKINAVGNQLDGPSGKVGWDTCFFKAYQTYLGKPVQSATPPNSPRLADINSSPSVPPQLYF